MKNVRLMVANLRICHTKIICHQPLKAAISLQELRSGLGLTVEQCIERAPPLVTRPQPAATATVDRLTVR